MPEGHTIHRLAADLQASLTPDSVPAASPQGRFAEGAARIDGSKLDKAEAYGKHLFCWWDNGDVLHVHLGLIGKFRPVPPETLSGETIRLRLDGLDQAWQLTGPQTCAIINPTDRDRVVEKLGPDPLRRGASRREQFIDRFTATSRAAGAALLDQHVIAGIGNVYRAELLLLTGIHPARPANTVSRELAGELWDLTVSALKRGKAWNRIVTVASPDSDVRVTRNIDPDDALYAYHRSDQPCRRCHCLIESQEVAGRTIWFCPTCQPK